MPVCDDLATKAELQELRDQLNAVLGEKQGGGSEILFAENKSTGVVAVGAGLTLFGLAKTNAPKVITDIALQTSGSQPIWKELSQGTAKLLGFKGNGQQLPINGLNQVAKVAGQNTANAASAAKVSSASANGIGLLANLATIGATLAINIATVKVLDKRIEAESRGAQMQIDAVNNGMIRLFQKQNGNIDAINGELDINKQNITLNRQNIEAVRSQITDVEVANASLRVRMNTLETQGNQTKAEIEAVKNEINAFNAEVDEITQGLRADIAKTELSVNEALATIAEQKALIETVYEEIEQIKLQVANLDERISNVEIEIDELKAQFEELRADLEPDVELLQARSTLQEARLILLEKKALQGGGGGAPVGLTQGAVNAQNKLLELTSKLNATQQTLEPLTVEDMLNDPDIFNEKFDQLLTGVQTGDMTPEQLEDLRTNLKTDFDTGFNTSFANLVVPRLDDLTLDRQAPAFKNLVGEGICQSLNNPGGCSGTPGNPTPTNGLKGMKDAADAKADALLALMGAADLNQGQSILGIVKNTNQVVNSTEHGLAKIQSFASKAWEATHADKILNALSTAMVIHNGIMLSNNVLATIGEAGSITLDAMGLKDSNGQAFDVSEIVRTKMTGMIESVLGAENYAALTARIAAYSRIYQSSANVLNLVQEIGDSARSVAETTCENTGKIGNALLESGVVYENAYQEMIDKVNPHSKAMLKLERFRNGLETIEEGASAISEVSSEVIETRENFAELKEAKDDWKTANDELLELKREEKTARKAESQAETDVNKPDFGRDESEQ